MLFHHRLLHRHFCNHPSERERESTYLINKSDDRKNNVTIMTVINDDKFEMRFALFDFNDCKNRHKRHKKNCV